MFDRFGFFLKVVSSITTTMLRKKINERRAANNSIIEKKKIAPVSSDPSGSSATHLNIPASVDSKFRRPFRRFIRRGSLMDVVPSFADNHSKSRHPSLDSLSRYDGWFRFFDRFERFQNGLFA